MVPKSDIERFIQAIIDDGDAPSAAKCRIEQYLTDILEERVSTLEPAFRIEYYLAKISGADVELPGPISRADLYLAALAGEEVTLPDTPNSSLEEYLARWCETGNAVSVITGNIVSFTGRTSTEIQSVSFDLHPAQDSNGYGIFPINSRTGLTVYRVGHELISIPQYSGSKNGCALTVLDSHTIRISGTPSAEARFTFPLSTNADFEFDPSTMRFFIDGAPNGLMLSVAKAGPRGGYKNFSILVKTTFSGEATDIDVHLYAKEDTSNTPEAYMETAYPVTWENKVGHSVYGGTVDLVSGVLKERPFIASYNGETLVGPWVSSMDAYDPNTTPTIGAQVVDMGGTETIYNLTPHEISALLGRNNIWSDSGDVKVTLKGGFTDQGE